MLLIGSASSENKLGILDQVDNLVKGCLIRVVRTEALMK